MKTSISLSAGVVNRVINSKLSIKECSTADWLDYNISVVY